MDVSGYIKFISRFFITLICLLLAAAFFVFLFDPFFHYHEPFFGLKKVLTQPEYQCIGTIRNFSYDSVLLGSSTAENYNNSWFDEGFSCTTVKAIKTSGTVSDLQYYLDEAFTTHDIANVFYSLDLHALAGDPETNFLNEDMPLYLYDDNPFNDVSYLLNKDVIFEEIPYMIAMSISGYDEGESYNWWQYGKAFFAEGAMNNYPRSESVTKMLGDDEWKSIVDTNISTLENTVRNHPETTFYFFLSPYSALWWDDAYRSGLTEEYLYAREMAAVRLLAYDNVKFFDFQTDEDIILNLDNYMDPIHFSPEINHLMADELSKEDSVYLITPDSTDTMTDTMRALSKKCMELTDELYEERSN